MQHTTIAVDVAKSVFQVAVSDRPGRVKAQHRVSRGRFVQFFVARPPATVLLEACGSACTLRPYASGVQAVSNPVPNSMQHHIQVGAGDPQDMTDVLSGELLDFPQDKRQRLPGRCGIKAGEDLGFDLLVMQGRVDRLRWRAPATAGVEPTLKGLVDFIHLPIALPRPARLGDLLVQDAEEPRPHTGPPLEAGRCLDKRRERGLRDVICLLGIEARTARRAEDLGEVGLDDGLDGGAIARPDLRREVGILRCRGRCI